MKSMLYSNNTRPEVNREALPVPSGSMNMPADCCKYLNKFNDALSGLIENRRFILKFVVTERHRAKHPVNRECRPDFVAVRADIEGKPQYWTCMEATAEARSEKDKNPQSKAAAYTAFHLRARPDYISVVGIFTDIDYFQLFLTTPCRVYQTKPIKWNGGHATRILFAWLWRIYHPEVDSSMTVTLTMRPIFNIYIPGYGCYSDLLILRTAESLGRRTTIMTDNSDPPVIIKEQYIEPGRRYAEGPILAKIHNEGSFPGVIRLDTYGPVLNDGKQVTVRHKGQAGLSKSIVRNKVRLVLKDTGEEIMNAQTPREVLMALYDLLEVLDTWQSLAFYIGGKGSYIVTSALTISYFDLSLLSLMTEDRSPLSTRVLLIDFDVAQDTKAQLETMEKLMHRTGTPGYMARAVRRGEPASGLFELPPMSEVTPGVKDVYGKFLKERLDTFGENDPERFKIQKGTQYKEEFGHQLHFDAESVFWVLLRWCIQAQPKDPLKEEPIDSVAWGALVNSEDARDQNFISIRDMKDNILHSGYQPLSPLLDEMRAHLNGDLAFATSGKRGHSEYLHEVFQRVILNFLFENNTKSFMDVTKHEKPRTVAQTGKKRNRTGTTTSRTTTSRSIRTSIQTGIQTNQGTGLEEDDEEEEDKEDEAEGHSLQPHKKQRIE
ncbi:hypothetical protein M408DRAFT_24839 [Serendipita vermifera MAFF 305830]|uniref:Fungal-type protein kinase domain-containing protein n=1 Tax=Serendipita vermifera MAFF 305830 TaxID=933852 RepID=A0A0C2WLC3_SERVB|nr:hypothetical protein M408DRAFT_24839 [Serendipita vermifera MAFF 305830]